MQLLKEGKMKSSIQYINNNIHKNELKKQIKEEHWIETILNRGGCCLICGYNDDPTIIEEHHFAGKHNSNITIPVCPICHRKLSNWQKGWNKEWTLENNPPEKRLAFMFRGIADILSLFLILLKEASDSMLKWE